MRLNGSEDRRSKYSSWCRGDSDRVAAELRTRQMNAQKSGVDYGSETVVTRASRSNVCDVRQERNSEVLREGLEASKPKKSSQSTMGIFGNTSSSTRKSSGNGFFDKILKDMDVNASSKQPAQKKSWIKGVGDTVPQDKRASIERSLKWMEQRFDDKPVASPACSGPDALFEGNGKSFEGNGQAQVAETMVAVSECMSKAVQSDVFMSIRSRLGNLLLQDLPEGVTQELRQMGKELENLSTSFKQV